ncbi:hypothetical protein HWV03_12340 [Moritella sp. 36]|uniref:hypothetical protein n=1 Tax=Moritella sp. 36 TaxID=2746233 RepID=UPI001BAD89C7|nr:hypothetical protein [Moritella sp. 36]QUM89532.1 hypothetical protein HWV03_12340 [Moritella sp. 36]
MKIELTTLEDAESLSITSIIDALKIEKQKAIECNDEAKANNCWRELESLELNLLYIRAFHNIKSHEYRAAWELLEQCEIKYEVLIRNSSEEYLNNTRLTFIKNKIPKWQSLYPYCLFCSPGFKVGYYSCSICDHKVRPRSRCEHKKGKLYNGELCSHVAHDLEMFEISIVSKPVQKYSVIHDDSTLDFTLLERLSIYLDNAFEEWDLNWTTMKFPVERFKNIKKEDKCPCESGNEFQACCIGKEEIEIAHLDFIFSKALPNDAEAIMFPY